MVNDIKYFPFDENKEVVHPNEAGPISIIVFNDVACDKQDNIRAFFSMGIHRLIKCFDFCQMYPRIPKHLIRDNVNFSVLFSKFKELCSACCDNKYGCSIIDKGNKRYRKWFDCFINFSN